MVPGLPAEPSDPLEILGTRSDLKMNPIPVHGDSLRCERKSNWDMEVQSEADMGEQFAG